MIRQRVVYWILLILKTICRLIAADLSENEKQEIMRLSSIQLKT